MDDAVDDDAGPDPTAAPELHTSMEPLRSFVGTWRGEGAGEYPTITPFHYVEEVEFWQVGKPFLGYQQRTRHPDTGLAMHTESGYWRIVSPPVGAHGIAAVEAVIAQPTGITEILVGEVRDQRITVSTTEVARTPSAKSVTAVTRTLQLEGDELGYEVHMAAVGQPLQFHLRATLHRVA